MLGRCKPAHDWLAAFAASVGGRERSVVVILPVAELVRSFGAARKVLSIPPGFFSGLGVRALGCSPDGGARCVDGAPCRLIVLGASSTAAFGPPYDGRFGCGGGRRSEYGEGRGRSAIRA